MAVKEMTPVKGNLNKITEFAFEAASSASEGFQVKLPRTTTDEYVIVLVQNTGGSPYNFTVKKPTKGSYYAAGGDAVHSVPAGGFGFFRFESAKWANNDGTMLFLPENVAVKAAVLY